MAEETKQASPGLAERVKQVRTLVKEAADAPMMAKPAAITFAVLQAVDLMEEIAVRVDRIGGGDA